MIMVEEKMESVKAAYELSSLPERPDIDKAGLLLVQIREAFYTG
jgi:hypothetical protein